jgi:cytochrome c biogenesis protein CcmG/thiol:disulfide interchange protein DsbE
MAALAWGLAHPAGGAADAVLGRPAPDLAVRALDGGPAVSVAQLRGRPVVLNFWASWCAPCRQEAGALQAAAQRWSDRVSFLGVDIQDTDAAATAYQSELRAPYPVGPPASGIPAAYGVKAPPETFFLDARGVVAARFIGPLDNGLIDRYLQLVGVH